jgi:hypothetical protein
MKAGLASAVFSPPPVLRGRVRVGAERQKALKRNCLGIRSWMILGLCLALQAAAPASIAPDATTDQVLDALHATGDDLTTLSADVTMDNVDQTTADQTGENGAVLLEKLPSGDWRVRINFTQRTEGDKIIKEHHEYTLAAGMLTDRDYDKQTEVQRQVVKPGQKIDPLKLGEGPFPLPIGQKKEAVHNQFDVLLLPPDKDDPADSTHLQLKPKPDNNLARRFAQVDVWVDRQSAMPVRIVTLDQTRQTLRTTNLKNLRLGQTVADADFALPDVKGWNVTIEPFGQ